MIEPLAVTPWWMRWGLAALIAASAVAVYWNTLDNEFVTWDDADYVYNNPLLKGGLGSIWGEVFKEKKHEQYYPLVFTSYWIEYQFVGLSPRLYHVTQMGLHAANAMLWLFVLRWLGVTLPAAALTAALFAVHPINVASVAWVTERKNTLSGLFFLISLLLYLQHRHGKGTWRYWASVASLLLALFAKTTVVVLPVLLIVSDRLLDRRWTKASLRRAIPYLALAFVMAVITINVEREHSKSGRPMEPALRPLVASAAIVHYLGKIIWPAGLLPLYPRWPESFGEPRYWISAAMIVVAGALLIRFRKKLGVFALWCAAMFLLPLAPVIGLIHFNLMQFSFVSDHLVYLSAPGVFLAAALALERAFRRPASSDPAPRPRTGFARPALMIVVVTIALGGPTVRRNRVWRDGVTFWECTLAGNPDCVPGNLNLGNHYERNKQYEKALPYYREATRLTPDHVNSPRFYAKCCRQLGRHEEAIEYYQEALRRADRKNPRYTAVHLEYANYLRSLGRWEEARVAYERVLQKDRNDESASKALRALSANTSRPAG